MCICVCSDQMIDTSSYAKLLPVSHGNRDVVKAEDFKVDEMLNVVTGCCELTSCTYVLVCASGPLMRSTEDI